MDVRYQMAKLDRDNLVYSYLDGKHAKIDQIRDKARGLDFPLFYLSYMYESPNYEEIAETFRKGWKEAPTK